MSLISRRPFVAQAGFEPAYRRCSLPDIFTVFTVGISAVA